jgi:hypothetical protein
MASKYLKKGDRARNLNDRRNVPKGTLGTVDSGRSKAMYWVKWDNGIRRKEMMSSIGPADAPEPSDQEIYDTLNIAPVNLSPQ